MIAYYDRQQNPITTDQYLHLFERRDYRVVVQDRMGDIDVITSWLGMDQGGGFPGEPPLIFGTILYDCVSKEYHSEEFSATETDALELHRRRVAELQGS